MAGPLPVIAALIFSGKAATVASSLTTLLGAPPILSTILIEYAQICPAADAALDAAMDKAAPDSRLVKDMEWAGTLVCDAANGKIVDAFKLSKAIAIVQPTMPLFSIPFVKP